MIWIVEVSEREDGLYAFEEEDNADAFAEAVRDNGGEAWVTETPLGDDSLASLVAAESGD